MNDEPTKSQEESLKRVRSDPELQAALEKASAGLSEEDDVPRKSLDDLAARALAYRTGPEFKALLDFCKRFPHLSPYNAMLLHIQNPHISFALRVPTWERKYERRVSRGARPYVILQPFGPVAFVFDLSDTKPINPQRDLVPEIVTDPLPAKGQPPAGALQSLIAVCLQIRIVVKQQELATHHGGSAIQFGGGTFGIVLNSKHTEARHIGTLAHELGHIFCGHLGAIDEGFWPDRSHASIDVKEFEAEAVAYWVTDRLNLDIGSVQYLAGYLSDDTLLPNYSLDNVLKAVGKIEEMLRGTFRVRRLQRTKANDARN